MKDKMGLHPANFNKNVFTEIEVTIHAEFLIRGNKGNIFVRQTKANFHGNNLICVIYWFVRREFPCEWIL